MAKLKRLALPLLSALTLVAVLTGCGGESGAQGGGANGDVVGGGSEACPAPSRIASEGRCVAPGFQDDGCPAGTLMNAAGACQAAGIPPEACGEGFTPENGSCTPILPAALCAAGTMAIPGETSCRPVMDCGNGRWGALPIDATTEHVDQSYAGGQSDGSAAKPWTTIMQGVDAAAPGALIAVAAGTYAERVFIKDKAVRLWGVCPDRVLIDGSSKKSSITVASDADGSVIGGLATSGGEFGINLSGSVDVTLDRVWIREATTIGLFFDSVLGPTRVVLQGALIEQNTGGGVFVTGSELSVDRTVVRSNLPRPNDGMFGRGIDASFDTRGEPSKLTVKRSLVARNNDAGILVNGSQVQIESTVVRDTLPQKAEQNAGVGIRVEQMAESNADATVLVKGSWVAGNRRAGIDVREGQARVEATVMRANLPTAADGFGGWGLVAFDSSSIEVVNCVVEDNHEVGLAFAGSHASIISTRISRTQPIPIEAAYGWGVGAEPNVATGRGSQLQMRGCVVEDNHEVGVLINGSEAIVEGTLVRATRPRSSGNVPGLGIHAQSSTESEAPSALVLRGSLVTGCSAVGVLLLSIGSEITSTLIENIAANSDGLYGDAIAVLSVEKASKLDLQHSSIATTARAGISNHGGAIAIRATTVQCAPIALNGETMRGTDYQFDDGGDNACGCPEASEACHVVSAGLQAPAPPAERP